MHIEGEKDDSIMRGKTSFHLGGNKISVTGSIQSQKDLIIMEHALARILISTCYKFGQPLKRADLGLLFHLL